MIHYPSPAPTAIKNGETRPKTGGCLQPFWRRWAQLSPTIGRWIRTGFKLPFACRPPTAKNLPQKALSQEEETCLDAAVVDMLQAEAIFKNDDPGVVTSSIYTVPKQHSDQRRPVINLRFINRFTRATHFKMSSIRDVKAAVHKGDFMAKIDLKDCFWQVPIYKKHQKYLSFKWRDKVYSFKTLPFGLNAAPWAITKIWKPVVAELQRQGHRVILYIDDMLVLGNDKAKCEEAVQATLKLMSELGAIVNFKKSQLVPSQVMEYLGFEIDSSQMTIKAPRYKIKNLLNELKKFRNRPCSSPRQVASLLGKLNSLADALFPTRVHTWALNNFKVRMLKRKNAWDSMNHAPPEVMSDVQWWILNLKAMNGISLIHPSPTMTLATDASDFGWGGWYQEAGKKIIKFGGFFSEEESHNHINWKELKALLFSIRILGPQASGHVIRHLTDNTVTMFYSKKLGGRIHSLDKLATEIFELTIRFNCKILSQYLPGVENKVADHESRRQVSLADAKLHPSIFQTLDHRWGPHSIDLFATAENAQLPRFASWAPQPGATFVNAMTTTWSNETAWIYPPFSMTGAIHRKLMADQASATLIAPWWPAQSWFPLLLKLSVEPPVLLPPLNRILVLPLGAKNNLKREIKSAKWHLLAWKISGSNSIPWVPPPNFSPQFNTCGRLELIGTTRVAGGLGHNTARR